MRKLSCELAPLNYYTNLAKSTIKTRQTALRLSELASTVARTVRLPVVAQYLSALQPEFGVFRLAADEQNAGTGVAGIIDAIAYSSVGKPEVVFDWKSDVAPTAERRQHYAAQVREYLSMTGAIRGIVVYMATGESQEVT